MKTKSTTATQCSPRKNRERRFSAGIRQYSFHVRIEEGDLFHQPRGSVFGLSLSATQILDEEGPVLGEKEVFEFQDTLTDGAQVEALVAMAEASAWLPMT